MQLVVSRSLDWKFKLVIASRSDMAMMQLVVSRSLDWKANHGSNNVSVIDDATGS